MSGPWRVPALRPVPRAVTAGSSVQAVSRILQQTTADLLRALDGEPVVGVVNGLGPVVRRREQP